MAYEIRNVSKGDFHLSNGVIIKKGATLMTDNITNEMRLAASSGKLIVNSNSTQVRPTAASNIRINPSVTHTNPHPSASSVNTTRVTPVSAHNVTPSDTTITVDTSEHIVSHADNSKPMENIETVVSPSVEPTTSTTEEVQSVSSSSKSNSSKNDSSKKS